MVLNLNNEPWDEVLVDVGFFSDFYLDFYLEGVYRLSDMSLMNYYVSYFFWVYSWLKLEESLNPPTEGLLGWLLWDIEYGGYWYCIVSIRELYFFINLLSWINNFHQFFSNFFYLSIKKNDTKNIKDLEKS